MERQYGKIKLNTPVIIGRGVIGTCVDHPNTRLVGKTICTSSVQSVSPDCLVFETANTIYQVMR